MKKLIKYTLGYTGILGVMFAASGCSDWLEPKPLSFFTPENTFNSYEGLKTSTDMLNRDVRYFDYYPTAGSAEPCILSEYFLFRNECERTYRCFECSCGLGAAN